MATTPNSCKRMPREYGVSKSFQFILCHPDETYRFPSTYSLCSSNHLLRYRPRCPSAMRSGVDCYLRYRFPTVGEPAYRRLVQTEKRGRFTNYWGECEPDPILALPNPLFCPVSLRRSTAWPKHRRPQRTWCHDGSRRSASRSFLTQGSTRTRSTRRE